VPNADPGKREVPRRELGGKTMGLIKAVPGSLELFEKPEVVHSKHGKN